MRLRQGIQGPVTAMEGRKARSRTAAETGAGGRPVTAPAAEKGQEP